MCVYTGRFGCIISPSIEAKRKGVKTGMRLDEAMKICPELVPLETNPQRYREFHIKIIAVLRKYSDDVIPKSIDEAIINMSTYSLIYKDLGQVAMSIKRDIRIQVGDWLKCSIGIAPNAFLAKLATELKKPDGLVFITPETIDKQLEGLRLTDLPGIAKGMAERLMNAGINTPLQLRHTPPEKIRSACRSKVGEYWHMRLNFGEVDMHDQAYRSMQAQRQVSKQQRSSIKTIWEIFTMLCQTLEKRLVRQEVYCREISFSARYENGGHWKDSIKLDKPIQDGAQIMTLLKGRMDKYSTQMRCESVINTEIVSMGVGVFQFVSTDSLQIDLFEDNVRQHNLRKTVYDLKSRFGENKLMKATELSDSPPVKDVIGFGSVKDLHQSVFDTDFGDE